MTRLDEEHETLWLLTIAPGIWAVHLLSSYITAAVWCARYSVPGGSLDTVRAAIAAYTAVALAGIAIVGWQAYRRHSFGAETVPHDFDSRADRHRFIGFATLLLAGLSAVATAYSAIAVSFFRTCR
jgi:hypothetical protein